MPSHLSIHHAKNVDLECISKHHIGNYGSKSKKGDYHLNKLNILNSLTFTHDKIGFPVISPTNIENLPEKMISFSKAIPSKDSFQIVHFYESDTAFVRIMNNPKKYAEILKKFQVVISPDFSQKLDMPSFICFQNSWWNKAFGAYWQTLGITVIPNVAWSRPDSYEYAFQGIPTKSTIAINCTGIKGNPMSKYFWMRGYEEALKRLNPTLIIRYGDKMNNEDESRSIYYENENLKNLKNGSKWKFCNGNN